LLIWQCNNKEKDARIYQEDIFTLDVIAINGGQRGFLVEISPDCLIKYLDKKIDAGLKI